MKKFLAMALTGVMCVGLLAGLLQRLFRHHQRPFRRLPPLPAPLARMAPSRSAASVP